VSLSCKNTLVNAYRFRLNSPVAVRVANIETLDTTQPVHGGGAGGDGGGKAALFANARPILPSAMHVY
jgi:hypothetical protein